MGVEIRSFSLDAFIDEYLTRAAARFGISKSRIVNELLRRGLPELMRAGSFEYTGIREAHEQ